MYNIILIVIAAAFILRKVKEQKDQVKKQENENADTGTKITSANSTQTRNEGSRDYLQRKSHEDEVSRKKDEWEDRREEQKNVGNLLMAKRLPFGSDVPPGNRLVICSYCGAENLVLNTSHEKQHCYFCRSSLPRI